MSKTPRIRRFPGAQVWALAQDAYLRGESADSIARRLDLTVNGIRKRAARKGWTRTQHAAALKRVEHPMKALDALLARIGQVVHAGRFEEVGELVRSADALVRTLRAAPPSPPPVDPKAQAEWRRAETRRLEAHWRERALIMAQQLLTDDCPDWAGDWGLSALRWRAQTLGPEQAARDFARGVQGGWADRYWDEAGRLHPPAPPREPDGFMRAQHARRCAAQREGEGW